jgi:hypothetical protein
MMNHPSTQQVTPQMQHTRPNNHNQQQHHQQRYNQHRQMQNSSFVPNQMGNITHD